MKNLRNKLVAGILAAALVAVPVGAYAQEALNTDNTAAVMDVDETTEEYAEDAFVDTSYAKASVKDPVVINDMYEQAGDDYAADDESLYDEYDALSGYNYAELLDAVINSGLYECADYEPAAGDVVFYDDVYTDEDGVVWNIEDYGIIEDMSDDGFTIIGNDGDLYDLNPDSVTGYGVLSEADDIENLIDIISEEDAAEEDVTDESSANKDTPDDDIQASEDIETPEDADISDNAATIDDTESGIHVEDPEDASKTDDAAVSEVAEMPDVTETPDKNETEKAGDNTKAAGDVNDIMPAVINDVFFLNNVLNHEIETYASTTNDYFTLEYSSNKTDYSIGDTVTYTVKVSFTKDTDMLNIVCSHSGADDVLTDVNVYSTILNGEDYNGDSYDFGQMGVIDIEYYHDFSAGDVFELAYTCTAAEIKDNVSTSAFVYYDSNYYFSSDTVTNSINIIADGEAFAVYSADDNSLTFAYGTIPESGDIYEGKAVSEVYELPYHINERADTPWYSIGTDVSKVIINKSFTNEKIYYLDYWFYGFTNASFSGLENINTSSLHAMQYTFYNCYGLTSIDALSDWDTSSLSNIQFAFYGCDNLISIDPLACWNTDSLEHMSNAFYGCSTIKDVNALKNWNISNLLTLDGVFNGCSSLADISALSSWDVSNVTSLSATFSRCSSLASISALSSWDVSNVTSLSATFSKCSSLANISALSSWDVSNATTLNATFSECYVLEDLSPISDWDTSKVTDMYSTFGGCFKLTSIEPLAGWDTSNVTTMGWIFDACSEIEDVSPIAEWDTKNVTSLIGAFDYWCSATSMDPLSNWDTSSVTNMNYIFEGCEKVEEFNLSGWDTSNVTTMNYMFSECSALTKLNIDSFDTQKITYIGGFATDCPSLEYIKIGDDFDLFTKNNSRLVDNKNWYDSTEYGATMSTNYLIGVGEAGEYWAYTTGSITVKKVDADTQEPLADAEFTLTSSGLNNGSFNFTTDENGQYTIDVYADSDGYITLYDKDENVISNSNVSSLDCTLTETKAPDGYAKSDDTKELTISPVVNSKLVYEYTFEDEPIKPELTITKTAGKEFCNAGDEIEFTITVEQTVEDATATGVTVTDYINTDGLTYVDNSVKITGVDNASIINGNTNTLIIYIESMEYGDVATITFNAIVGWDHVGSQVSNTATVICNGGDEQSATATINVLKSGISITKTADQKEYKVGDTVTYTIEVEETEPNARTGKLHLEDYLPSEVKALSATAKIGDEELPVYMPEYVGDDDIGVYKDGEMDTVITKEIFDAAEAEAPEKELIYYDSNNNIHTVTAQFISLSSLLNGYESDEGCGVMVTSHDGATNSEMYSTNDTYIYRYYDEEYGDYIYRLALDYEAEECWLKDIQSITLGHIIKNGECTICGMFDEDLPDTPDISDAITVDADSLTYGETLTLTITCEAIKTGENIENFVTAEDLNNHDTDYDTADIDILPPDPEFAITKTADKDVYYVGDTVTYTITIEQTVEGATATGIYMDDSPPLDKLRVKNISGNKNGVAYGGNQLNYEGEGSNYNYCWLTDTGTLEYGDLITITITCNALEAGTNIINTAYLYDSSYNVIDTADATINILEHAILPNAGGMRTLWGIIIGSAVVAAGITYAAVEERRRKKAAA